MVVKLEGDLPMVARRALVVVGMELLAAVRVTAMVGRAAGAAVRAREGVVRVVVVPQVVR